MNSETGSQASPFPTLPHARHDLLSVPPEAWPGVLAARDPARRLPPGPEAVLSAWAAAGRPVVARRSAPGDPAGTVGVAVPLPPGLGKARVTLSIPAGVPLARRAPVFLDGVRDVAPPHWGAAMDSLTALGRSLELRPRVFGALLWRAVTGLDYLHPGSDLDLLWRLRDAGPLPRLLDGLAAAEADAPFRIDGEISIGAAGVNWRELDAARRGAATAVLLKTVDRVALVPVDDLLSGQAAAWC